MKANLAIFTRVPRLGRVKTRLEPLLGVAGALEAHRALLDDTLARLSRVSDMPAELWFDEHVDESDRWGGWQAGGGWGLPVRCQHGVDLGERMLHALMSALDRGVCGILVGADCPSIDATYVRMAAAALDDHDLVLGPAEDGGFGLIGLRRPAAALFDGIVWGKSDVLALTLAGAARLGLSSALLPTIWDVDTPADWRRWQMIRGQR